MVALYHTFVRLSSDFFVLGKSFYNIKYPPIHQAGQSWGSRERVYLPSIKEREEKKEKKEKKEREEIAKIIRS